MRVLTPDYNETPTPEASEKENQFQKIEAYLAAKYEFRNNLIKCKPEILSNGTWQPLSKYQLNGYKREMAHALKTPPATKTILEVIESPAFPMVNPVKEYFTNLETPADQTDYINLMADTLTPAQNDILSAAKLRQMLRQNFKKWLVGAVACALVDEVINHTCLVLTGGQGIFKTTWLNNLCPPYLKDYLYCNHLNLQQKDSQTLLAECFLINIDDQLQQINKKDANEIKNIITAPIVKYRRPYDTHIQEYPRIASFCASVNGNDFLTDTTGNRRFLPFEIEAINIQAAKQIPLNKMYAQAVQLFRAGFQYWFTSADVKEMEAYNTTFEHITPEEQFLNLYFEPTEEQKIDNEYFKTYDNYYFLNTASILSFMQMETGGRFIEKRVGEALNKNMFIKRQLTINNKRQRGYFLTLIRKPANHNAANFLNTLKDQPF